MATASLLMVPTWWPSGEGLARCMRMALASVTPLGDIVKLKAVRESFEPAMPPLFSTKALTGHSLGTASVHETTYSLLMMQGGFIAG